MHICNSSTLIVKIDSGFFHIQKFSGEKNGREQKQFGFIPRRSIFNWINWFWVFFNRINRFLVCSRG
jgi:hypothetical protein